MWFEQVLFFVAAIGALGGAIGVVAVRNPFYSVLALVAHLLSLAVLFLLLRAEFLAAAQVVVYAGAVMVLYVFVVAYIGGVDEPLGEERAGITRIAPLFALALLVEICLAVFGTGLSAIDTRGAHVGPGFGSPGEIGRLLLERFLLAFEAASFLLLVAAVGAVVLARRRRGLEELGGDELPERAGQAPLAMGPGGPSSLGEDTPTRIPAGTAEGPGDPTVERSPDHETQETPA
jgi:NADH-quinone oxidoreductase subunit J